MEKIFSERHHEMCHLEEENPLGGESTLGVHIQDACFWYLAQHKVPKKNYSSQKKSGGSPSQVSATKSG